MGEGEKGKAGVQYSRTFEEERRGEKEGKGGRGDTAEDKGGERERGRSLRGRSWRYEVEGGGSIKREGGYCRGEGGGRR